MPRSVTRKRAVRAGAVPTVESHAVSTGVAPATCQLTGPVGSSDTRAAHSITEPGARVRPSAGGTGPTGEVQVTALRSRARPIGPAAARTSPTLPPMIG